jgi:hypothetical protein
MKLNIIKNLRKTANGFVMVGLMLMVINIIDLFHYTRIDGDEIENINDRPRTVSEQEFWDNAYKQEGESDKEYSERLTALIDHRMIAVDPEFAIPTFFENWILWLRSQFVVQHEWVNTNKAIRLGGGFCSQHAIVLDNLLDEQGIESRILSLGGHVINEILINGKWKVHDSNYNIVFDKSLNELENNPNLVYEAYLKAGNTESLATKLQDIYSTAENNWHFRNSRDYSSAIYFFFEKIAIKLIWFIPVFLVILGLLTRFWISRVTIIKS